MRFASWSFVGIAFDLFWNLSGFLDHFCSKNSLMLAAFDRVAEAWEI